jgi:pimeloyl-ACP methyl ester carboxylesterase
VWGKPEFVIVEGHRLRVVGAGSGSPLLLINGIGAPAEMWTPLTKHFSGPEFVAVDLPGIGSSPPSRRPLRIRGLARLLTGVLDQLGYRKVDVLGFSFGSFVAQELAWRAPERVRRLVLCAASGGVGTLPPKPLAAVLMLTPARYQNDELARRVVPRIAGGRTARDPAVLQAGLVHRLANPPSTPGYLGQLYAASGWSSAPWLRRVRHSTLILHGTDDPVVPVANARTMTRVMPNAQLHILEGAGHLFLLDEPAAVAPVLSSFLAR